HLRRHVNVSLRCYMLGPSWRLPAGAFDAKVKNWSPHDDKHTPVLKEMYTLLSWKPARNN
ncbi:MAG: hypothetical protein PVG95_08580, partial [Methyloceanibacter sp.]